MVSYVALASIVDDHVDALKQLASSGGKGTHFLLIGDVNCTMLSRET